jgi:hypothetical protein
LDVLSSLDSGTPSAKRFETRGRQEKLDRMSTNDTIDKKSGPSFEKAFAKAHRLLPNLVTEDKKHDFKGNVYAVMSFLSKHLKKELKKDPSLHHRNRAPALFISMGMEISMVEAHFRFIMSFEKEMGIVGKASFVATIHGFIDNLGYNNPVDEITTGAQSIESFDGDRYYHYGVNMMPDHLGETLEDVGLQFDSWARNNHFDVNPFMYGSTAARAAEVSDRRSLRISLGRHDFGPGFYCFGGGLKSSLTQALSFAVDRSLPGENPTIFVFPQPEKHIEKKMRSVDSRELKQKQLKSFLGYRYEDFDSRRNDWRTEDATWKSFVSLCRVHAYFPPRKFVYYGYLHDTDADKIEATNWGSEPVVDDEKWIQYCFPDILLLGSKILFLEFFKINDWVQNDSEKEQLDADINSLWNDYIVE